MDRILKKDGLSLELLRKISVQSSLNINLKKNLKYFDKVELLNEIRVICENYDENDQIHEIEADYRIKSFQSAKLKYERYYPDHQARKVFDDLLGFRALCDDYDEILQFDKVEHIRIADLSKGKATDDGYRGVHVYYQINNHYYPIEIQYNTFYDRQINNWLHKYIYKYYKDPTIGKIMREKYESGEIRSEKEFREVLPNVLSCCKTI